MTGIGSNAEKVLGGVRFRNEEENYVFMREFPKLRSEWVCLPAAGVAKQLQKCT